jgi:hypothetical protein
MKNQRSFGTVQSPSIAGGKSANEAKKLAHRGKRKPCINVKKGLLAVVMALWQACVLRDEHEQAWSGM